MLVQPLFPLDSPSCGDCSSIPFSVLTSRSASCCSLLDNRRARPLDNHGHSSRSRSPSSRQTILLANCRNPQSSRRDPFAHSLCCDDGSSNPSCPQTSRSPSLISQRRNRKETRNQCSRWRSKTVASLVTKRPACHRLWYCNPSSVRNLSARDGSTIASLVVTSRVPNWCSQHCNHIRRSCGAPHSV